MAHLALSDLEAFYETPLGRETARRLAARMEERWPREGGMTAPTTLIWGYAKPFLHEGERVEPSAHLIPKHLGPCHWPEAYDNRTALCDENAWPLFDHSVDRIMLLHGLEFAESPKTLLEEANRVLVGEGRVLVIVPNRTGLWASLEKTPFGHGKPYSLSQLDRLLEQAGLEVIASSSGLFMPPYTSKTMRAVGRAWHNIGRTLFKRLGGVLVVEAKKQVLRPTMVGKAEKVKSPALGELASPATRSVVSQDT